MNIVFSASKSGKVIVWVSKHGESKCTHFDTLHHFGPYGLSNEYSDRHIEAISLEQMHSTRHSRWISIRERFEGIDLSFFNWRQIQTLIPAWLRMIPIWNHCTRLSVGYQSRRAEYEMFSSERNSHYVRTLLLAGRDSIAQWIKWRPNVSDLINRSINSRLRLIFIY